MHYLGAVSEQLSHEDPQVVLARRRAGQRRDARRARRRTRDRSAAGTGHTYLIAFDWHVLVPHRH